MGPGSVRARVRALRICAGHGVPQAEVEAVITASRGFFGGANGDEKHDCLTDGKPAAALPLVVKCYLASNPKPRQLLALCGKPRRARGRNKKLWLCAASRRSLLPLCAVSVNPGSEAE